MELFLFLIHPRDDLFFVRFGDLIQLHFGNAESLQTEFFFRQTAAAIGAEETAVFGEEKGGITVAALRIGFDVVGQSPGSAVIQALTDHKGGAVGGGGGSEVTVVTGGRIVDRVNNAVMLCHFHGRTGRGKGRSLGFKERFQAIS